MKKKYLVFALIVLMACNSKVGNPPYLSAIANYVQTDKSGTKHDLNFKVLEWEEMKEITVEDSIQILSEQFKKAQQPFIKQLELAQKMNKDLLTSEKNRRNPKQQEIEGYEKRDHKINWQIDSVKNLSPNNFAMYEKLDKNKVLAKVIRCKYAVLHPIYNRTVEETYDFTISPNGSIVYQATKVKQ